MVESELLASRGHRDAGKGQHRGSDNGDDFHWFSLTSDRTIIPKVAHIAAVLRTATFRSRSLGTIWTFGSLETTWSPLEMSLGVQHKTFPGSASSNTL